MITILIICALLVVGYFLYKKFFASNEEEEVEEVIGPEIMGLRIGSSFDIDPLRIKLSAADVVAKDANPTHIIEASGIVDLSGTNVFRFYTDDDAWLQVMADGESEESVSDVKLMHYYDTQDIPSQEEWDVLLNEKIGAQTWELEGHTYNRVWTSSSDYHAPVHMAEDTYKAESEGYSVTDQFVMMFEREISGEEYETLFVSAEEIRTSTGQLERCLVLSTGISLSPEQITIHG